MFAVQAEAETNVSHSERKSLLKVDLLNFILQNISRVHIKCRQTLSGLPVCLSERTEAPPTHSSNVLLMKDSQSEES